MLTDDQHKLAMRAIEKTGCTSWKMLVINNTMHYKPWQPKMPWAHSPGAIRERAGMYQMNYFNKEAIITRLRNYVTMVTVRHPLTRLESAFKNKQLDRDKFAEDIRGDAEAFYERTIGERFQEWMDKLIDGHVGNKHWRNYVKSAHPCTIPYS
jgi:hypothetical protein